MEVYHDIQTLFFGSSGFVHNVLFTVPSVFGIYPYAQADGIYAQLFHQLEAVGFYAFMIVKLQPFFFHYSDSWADPGQQFKPKAWIGKSVAELKTAIAAHTIDILQALKAEDISPRWVQVGNEIRPGMLWDENVALSGAFYDIRECDVKGLNSTNERVKYPQNTQNLAEFVNTGYDAVKKIFPQSIVIVHIDNAWDDLTWWFKQFKEAGGKLDMIGLSHYPQTHSTKLWQEMNLLALKHISQLAKTFQVKVMITEIGVKQNDSASAQVLADFINKARDMESCAGVWYWEPECYEWNGYDMGAFDKNGKPTAIMNAFQSSTKRK